ncbi:MAG: cell envelope integrity protein TolA [Deltaproteobacteria bacterium]|nr:cell envelope integrity protein TolA [Deltaproteobacteria bacterium]
MQANLNQRMHHGDYLSFNRVLTISAGAHVLVILIWIIVLLIKTDDRIYFKPVYTTVSFVEAPAKPKKKKTVKKKPPAVATPTAAKKTKPKVNDAATAKVEAKKIADALSSLEEELKTKDTEAAIAASMEALISKKAAEEARIKEEALAREIAALKKQLEESRDVKAESQKTEPRRTGVSQKVFDIEFNKYYNTIGTLIQAAWIFPGDNAPKELQTTLSLRIAASGDLEYVRIETRSGNTLFDESALKAVKKASPLPKPPKEILDGKFLDIGVRFCPQGCE